MIRSATPKDAAAVAALYTQLTLEMATLAPTVIRPLMTADPQYFRDYITDANADVFVSTDGSRLNGFALVVAATTGADPEVVPHRFAFCIDLFVAPSARRQGLGRQLMAQVAAWGQAHDCEFVQLNVLGADHGARDFYAELGFAPQQLTLTRSLQA